MQSLTCLCLKYKHIYVKMMPAASADPQQSIFTSSVVNFQIIMFVENLCVDSETYVHLVLHTSNAARTNDWFHEHTASI